MSAGLLRLLLVLVLTFCYAKPSPAADPIVGTWKGTVDQPGHGSYEATMTLDSPGGGTIDYPSLNCGGSLSGNGSGGVYQYRETISYGGVNSEGKGCITGGDIRVVLQGDGLFWEWNGSYESENYYVSGKLYRTGPEPLPASCAECGEALMNDIASGLPRSQNFRNYTYEARQKYANCIGSIPEGCQNTCGRQLYDNLPNCESFDDPGHKACVETALNGARLSCP